MSVQTLSWEHQLLAWAHEALESRMHSASPAHESAADAETLEHAYRYCDALTQAHSRTFYLASDLLPSAKRSAVRALYAFCRVSDDLVDQDGVDPQAKLNTWRSLALAAQPGTHDPVALAWADVRARYHIPGRYAEQLIDGVARDLTGAHYATFDELAVYCYGVASTVGLMVMHIIGFADAEAIPYAIKLGVALQLTNILRDVGEDWQAGRLYLPQDELAAFGLSDADIGAASAGEMDERWRDFMRFQVERARRIYAEAMPGIALLDPDGRFAIGAAAELYRGILDDIEAHGYDVFSRRARVSTWGKLRRLPGIWWRSRAHSGILAGFVRR
jgi:phytoene synthase